MLTSCGPVRSSRLEAESNAGLCKSAFYKDQMSVFVITIDHKKSCKVHERYTEWLTKHEDEMKELEKKKQANIGG